MKTFKSSIRFSAAELLVLLRRALNTMEPRDQPIWATPLTDTLHHSDAIELTFHREVEDDHVPSPSDPLVSYKFPGIEDILKGVRPTVVKKEPVRPAPDPAVKG